MHADVERLAVLVLHLAHRQVCEILVELQTFLPAVLVDLLFEIAVAIQQRHRHERQCEITRGFAVVAAQDTETAGVVRE